MPNSTTAPVPKAVMDLAEERARRRLERDFAGADAIRDQLHDLGYDVTDGPSGPVLELRSNPTASRSVRGQDVPSVLQDPSDADVSLQWVVEGWPEDVVRAIQAFRSTSAGLRIQEVVVDVSGQDPSVFPDGVHLIQLDPDPGWGAARNVGLRQARGEVVVILDGSIEPTGDALTPLIEALADPQVGVVGPFGISTIDLRSFEGSDGPRVDAIEGYCLALRRQQVVDGLAFDEGFRFYRSADIDLSFRVLDQGSTAAVVALPVTKHEHRMWNATPQLERDRLSKRNYYRFLKHFRGRFDLTVAGAPPEAAERGDV